MDIDKLFSTLTTQLKGAKGHITVDLAGVKCKVISKDAIGHIMQEWLFEWSKSNNIKIIKNEQTQSFPDYFFIDNVGIKHYLEIKNFNYDANPAFDVADFYAFVETLPQEIEKLSADYIVFGYHLNEDGVLMVPRIWKFKIWEICGKSKDNHVTAQIRGKNLVDGIDTKGRIQKLRPYRFNHTSTENKFKSPLEFLTAIQSLLNMNQNTLKNYPGWLDLVKKSYKKTFKTDLS